MRRAHAEQARRYGAANSPQPTPMPDLTHFLAAQEHTHATALAELRTGAKRTHWMWFVFPQLAGLGHSDMARRYAMANLDHARAYLAHPVLGPRLREATRAALDAGVPPRALFGDMDAMKFASCMTLFAAAAEPGSEFHDALARGVAPDPLTLRRLADHASAPHAP